MLTFKNREIVSNLELVEGCTRNGTVYCIPDDVLSNNISVLDPDLFIYKLPDQLQWLVVDALGSFCWVFYSRGQRRLKCRHHHPNTPGW